MRHKSENLQIARDQRDSKTEDKSPSMLDLMLIDLYWSQKVSMDAEYLLEAEEGIVSDVSR